MGARAITPFTFELARATNAELRRCDVTGDDRAAGLARQFHQTLVGTCPNPYMLELLEREMLAASETLARVRSCADDLRQIADDHDEILDMISGGATSSELERSLREHSAKFCAALTARRRSEVERDRLQQW